MFNFKYFIALNISFNASEAPKGMLIDDPFKSFGHSDSSGLILTNLEF